MPQVTLRGRVFDLNVTVLSDALSVVLTYGAQVWRGSFSAQYIEEVSKKTGNFKRFPVFGEMLLSCLDSAATSTSTCALDLISAADLANTANNQQNISDITSHERVYLVLTYAAAFDRYYSYEYLPNSHI
ncbi:UNVERIFIED_CONTAM: Coiled-coil domain-containing protein 61 [Siphonaria sp. JEL0065]|nr:Coiled-coil domain-containing protein 61 [Siphonaria sp. JEL0065]